MPEPVLVTGAGGGSQGTTGTRIVGDLLRRGVPVRAFVHHPGKRSDELASLGAEVVAGDLLDIASVRNAFSGVRTAYFTYPVQDGLVEATAIFAAVARESQAERIVNLSQLSAGDPLAPSPRMRQHFLSEQVFDWAGPFAVHLRATIFFENILNQTADGVRRSGQVALPLGKGTNKIPAIAAADVARAATTLLMGPKRGAAERVIPLITQIITPNEIASTIGQALGRSVDYVNVDDEVWRRDFIERNGTGNALAVEHLSKLWAAIRQRNERAERVDPKAFPAMGPLLGGPPTTFAAFIQASVTAFGGGVDAL